MCQLKWAYDIHVHIYKNPLETRKKSPMHISVKQKFSKHKKPLKNSKQRLTYIYHEYKH